MIVKLKDIQSFYFKKNIVITGHTGFKGHWLSLFLQNFESNLLGISLDKKNIYEQSGFNNINFSEEIISDIYDIDNYKQKIINFNPEIVFYLASQPLVREAHKNPIRTFKSNVFGLVQFLNFCRSLKNLKVILVVTSDKVYENKNREISFLEDDKLSGSEPYGASKAIQEIISKCFYETYLKGQAKVITARAGNVLGGADWGKDRLIVDIVKSVRDKNIMPVRYPKNTRPWQYILDLIYGYLATVLKVEQDNEKFHYYNFSPKKSLPVSDILDFTKKYWGKDFNYILEKNNFIFEEEKLSISSEKIYKYIGWETNNDLNYILTSTFNWYSSFMKKEDMNNYNLKILNSFLKGK